MIKWSNSRIEHKLITDIAARASNLAQKHGVKYPVMDAMMDIEACHCNGCPLDLNELLAWAELGNSFDFAHDVFGIRRHINRETGVLENCFVPRCAAKYSVTAI